MGKAVVTSGQSFFAPGIVARQNILTDSTKEVSTAAANEFVMGAPIALDGSGTDQGKLKSVTDNVADVFYGACGNNINRLRGETSLGETTATRANACLQGIFTVRKSVFLDSSNNETTITPFTGFTSNFPVAADIGKLVDAIQVTSEAALGSVTMLKWGVGAGSSTGFADVAMIVDVRDNEEVDLLLTGKLVAMAINV